jgi:transposase
MATAGTRRPTRKGCPNHPIEFKRGLAAAACDPEVSVAKLALEHGVNTNLLFRWRRQYRMGMFGAPDSAHLPLPVASKPVKVPTRTEGSVTLLPVPLPVAVAPVLAALAALAVGRPDQALDVHLHQPLRDIADHLPQEVAVGPLLKQLGQCHPVVGHRFPLVR